MAFVGIVAIDRNGAIGKGGKLPWHYSADLKFFRAQTTGHACLMGSHTWHSIGRPLPQRLNLVLSRKGNEELPASVLALRSREDVLALAPFLRCDVFIIGGAQTYRAFAGEITRWIVTEVPQTVEDADVSMPADFLAGFREVENRELGEGLVTRFYEKE